MKTIAVLTMAMALGLSVTAFAADEEAAQARNEKKGLSEIVEVKGEVRYNYLSKKSFVNEGESFETGLRTRLWLTATPMENLSVNLMAENEHDFRAKRGANHHDIYLRRAYLDAKVGGANIIAGRIAIPVGDANVLDDDVPVDGVQISYGDKLKVEGFAVKKIDGNELNYVDANGHQKQSRAVGARLSYAPLENLEIKTEYAQFNNLNGEDAVGEPSKAKNGIFTLGASYEAAENLNVSALYIKGSSSGNEALEDTKKHGYVLGLAYGGAEAEEKGSWGVSFNYYNQGAQTYVAHGGDGNFDFDNGFKGWSLGADYAVAKNVVAAVTYYDTQDLKDSSQRDKRIWTEITYSF